MLLVKIFEFFALFCKSDFAMLTKFEFNWFVTLFAKTGIILLVFVFMCRLPALSFDYFYEVFKSGDTGEWKI